MLLEHEVIKLIRDCTVCGLCKQGNGPIRPKNRFDAPLFVLCDTPYAMENVKGQVLSGGPGLEFETYLRNVGLNINQCYCTNLIKCMSATGRYKKDEIDLCANIHVRTELNSWHGGNIVIALGFNAGKFFLGEDFDLLKCHGIPQVVDFVFSPTQTRKLTIFPCLPPTYGIGTTGKMALIQEDFKALRELIVGNIDPEAPRNMFPEVDYREVTFEEMALIFAEQGMDTIFVDTETANDMRTPWSVQFSFLPGTGYFFEVKDKDCLELFKSIVEIPDTTTVFHNAKFDLKILNNLGIYPTRFEDSMVYAYNLQNKPQGLKALSYRLAGMEMKGFREVTRKNTIEKFLSYFTKILSREWEDSPQQLEYVAKPEYQWQYEETKIPCTKRHKEKIVCGCREDNNDLPMPDCRQCEGKGFYRIKRKRGKKVLVEGTENGHWRLKTPQNIKTKVQSIVNAFQKDPSTDIVERWYNFSYEERRMVADTLGETIAVADLSEVPREEAIEYACKDADATNRIYWDLKHEADSFKLQEVIEVDNQIMQMALEMEEFGMPAVAEKFHQLSDYYEREMDELQEMIEFIGGQKVNLSSPKQVNDLLFNKLGLKAKKFTDWDCENASTDAEALMFIENQHPIVPIIMQWRQLQKAKTSFSDKLPGMIQADGRIRGNIKTTRTITGRLAMDEPNLMNIPNRSKEGQKVRECFIAPDGYLFVSGDYGQIEMRIACHCAKDPVMSQIFIKHFESGFDGAWDIHRQTAAKIWGIPVDQVTDEERTPAKSAGFGILNQISGQGLSDFLVKMGRNDWPADRCEQLIKDWFGVYKGIAQYFNEQKLHARRYGYVRDLFGRIYLMPEYKSALKNVRNQGERNTCNYFVQGGAQGVMKRGMLALRKEVLQLREQGFDIQYLVQIHDDQLDLVPEECVEWYVPLKKAIFENAVKLSIPLVSDCKVGKSWGELEKA